MPSAPHQLEEPSQTDTTTDDQPDVQQVGEPQQPESVSEETKQELWKAFGPQGTPEDAETPQRPRDDRGRFMPKQPEEQSTEEPSEPTEQPKLTSPWVDAAKDLFFTDDEIQSFKNEQALQDAVVGRQVRLMRKMSPGGQPQSGQPEQTPQQTGQGVSRETAPALEDFRLELKEGEYDETMTGPLKAVEQYLNQLKATQDSENQQIRQKLTALEQSVEQSAQSAQAAQMQNVVQEWDSIARSVPGMVEAMGLPSEVRSKPGTIENRRWQMIQPIVAELSERYSQVLGPERIDQSVMQRIAQEAFEVAGFGPLNGRPSNGQQAQRPNAGPGAVVGGSARATTMPEKGPTGEDEYDRAMSAVMRQWQDMGRNPFQE